MTAQVQKTQIFRKQALHASVTRACVHCGAGNAPGMGSHFEAWNCHVCGQIRLADEMHGEVWSKIWRAPTFVEYVKHYANPRNWFKQEEKNG